MKTAETRCTCMEDAQARVEKRADGVRVFMGYASIFDTWSSDLGGFVERVRPGAFSRALAGGADVRFLVNHDANLILARSRSGTMRLYEDDRGLRVEADFPDTDLTSHYVSAINRRDVDGMSFRFYIVAEKWDFSGETPRRDVIDVDIDDVSIATYPAYADTSAAVRSLESHLRSQPRGTPFRDRAERLLRLTEAQ